MLQNIGLDLLVVGVSRVIGDIAGLIDSVFFEGKEGTIKEQFGNAMSELSEAQSQTNSLNTELSDVNSQIDELLAKGELNFADREQLSNLKNISRELENQIKLSENLQENLKENAANISMAKYNPDS